MSAYVRPSNEALLRARAPGAQGQRGYPSNPHSFLSGRDDMMGAVPQNEFLIHTF